MDNTGQSNNCNNEIPSKEISSIEQHTGEENMDTQISVDGAHNSDLNKNSVENNI